MASTANTAILKLHAQLLILCRLLGLIVLVLPVLLLRMRNLLGANSSVGVEISRLGVVHVLIRNLKLRNLHLVLGRIYVGVSPVVAVVQKRIVKPHHVLNYIGLVFVFLLIPTALFNHRIASL